MMGTIQARELPTPRLRVMMAGGMPKKQRPELLSFDTNAWSNLMRGKGALRQQALIKLRREVRTGALQVVMSQPLLSELCGLAQHEPQLWRKAIRELAELGKGRMLQERGLRCELEKRLKRSLRGREMFRAEMSTAQVFRALTWQDGAVAEEVVRTRAIKDEWRAEELEKQAGVRAQSIPSEKKEWNRQFRKNPGPMIEDWARGYIDDEGCAVQSLPTVWHSFSYFVARVYLVGAEGEGPGKVDGNDRIDWEHYADASYSKGLVTDDDGVHRISKILHEPRIRVLTLDDWARLILQGQL